MRRDTDPDWWRGAVLYEIYPRSFSDSDGDGVGDLRGVAARLDYVASLGVDGIWLTPFFRTADFDQGYDLIDPRDVEPAMGTLAGFDALVERAHALGLKVVIDQVHSHTSDLCPWFQASRESREGPYADWYVWADPLPGGAPPNNWQCWFGASAWCWEPRRMQYYFANFHARMPDLNFHNPAVQDAVLETARFWLDRGVDGFRLDTCNFYFHDRRLTDNPPKDDPTASKPCDLQAHVHNVCQPENLVFLARLRSLMDAYPGRMAVAEIAGEDDVARTLEYTSGDTRLHTAYSFVLLRTWPGHEGFKALIEGLAADPAAWPSLAFSNHDSMRCATRWGEDDPAATRMHLALLLALRGTLFLYQGEELGLPQSDVPFEKMVCPAGLSGWPKYKGRDGCRTPFPWTADGPALGFSTTDDTWLPAEPAHALLAVDRQEGDADSTLALTRELLAWRSTHPEVRTGELRFLGAPEPVIAFVRAAGGAASLCVFNRGPEPVRWTPPQAVTSYHAASRGAAFEAGDILLEPYGFLLCRLA